MDFKTVLNFKSYIQSSFCIYLLNVFYYIYIVSINIQYLKKYQVKLKIFMLINVVFEKKTNAFIFLPH